MWVVGSATSTPETLDPKSLDPELLVRLSVPFGALGIYPRFRASRLRNRDYRILCVSGLMFEELRQSSVQGYRFCGVGFMNDVF